MISVHRWKSGAVISFAWGCANCATARPSNGGNRDNRREKGWPTGTAGTRRLSHGPRKRPREQRNERGVVTRRKKKSGTETKRKRRGNETVASTRNAIEMLYPPQGRFPFYHLCILYCIFRLLVPFRASHVRDRPGTRR